MAVEELKEKLCKGVNPSEDDSGFRRVEKVLAPFLKTLKKTKHHKTDLSPTVYEELYLKQSLKELLTLLRSSFTDPLELRTLMNETAELLKVVTKSKSVNLYLTDYDSGQIVLCPKYYQRNKRFERKYPIGTYLAAHVAFTKEYVISSDILGDVRFPQGIPDVPVVKSVICIPIITNVEENCIGVIELYRECSDKPYDLINLQICNALTAWMGIAVEQNTVKLHLSKEMKIQKELFHLADLYFSGAIPFKKTISDVLKVTKAAVNAEKGAFYFFHEPVPPDSQEVLTADVYEEGIDDSVETFLYMKKNRARFAKNQPGIPGYAARTGKIINIQDAYKDNRFDRKSDPPFYRTRSVAAFPVKNKENVLAVLSLINSLDYPYFRPEDIDLIQSLLSYVTLICGYFLLDKAHNKVELKVVMMDKLLDFHTKPSGEDINVLKYFIQTEQHMPDSFFEFQWDLTNFEEEALKYIAYVFLASDILEPCFEVQNLSDFLLRVKKSYRPAFYHNFEHAFCVFHFAFNIILRNKNVYTAAEIVTILLAALCHDIDHSGLTNTFLALTNDTVYKLYGDFCGEAHRFEFVIFLIQQTDLFSNVSAQTFQLIRKNLKRLILAFNLAIHFQNRQTITKLLNENSFDWENPEHRFLSQNMILVCSDNANSFKRFETAKKMTSMFYKELYKQGDLEKSMGFSPLPMLDRNKTDVYPENQIILLSVVVLPVVEILVRLFPNLTVLDDIIRNTLSQWNEMLQYRGLEMWKINQALMKDRKVAHKITLSSTVSSIKTIISQETRSLRF